MPPLRIRGLVRALRYVQNRMGQRMSEKDAHRLTDYVRSVVEEVKGICRSSSSSPADLPRPSREAFQFLSDLAQTGKDIFCGGDSARAFPARVPSVIRMTKSLLRELGTPEASDKGERPKGPYRASIMEVLARIEAACARRGIQPSQMAAPSRNAYGLLSYLATDGKASAYVGTATTVSRIWARIAEQGSQHGSVIVSLDDQTHIYRCLRRDRSSSDLHLSPVFIGAPEPVLESVVRMAIGIGAPMDKAAVHEFVHGPVPREILSAIAGFSAPLAQTKGVVYDLNEVCERVRHAHFTPPVEPPSSLAWTDTLTYRMFGLYSSVRDRITISRSLDSPDVPQYVIDYVMFHELIHKHHGIGWVAKQRSMHGGRFKKTERSFPHYQAAQEYLNRLSTKLRRRRK